MSEPVQVAKADIFIDCPHCALAQFCRPLMDIVPNYDITSVMSDLVEVLAEFIVLGTGCEATTKADNDRKDLIKLTETFLKAQIAKKLKQANEGPQHHVH